MLPKEKAEDLKNKMGSAALASVVVDEILDVISAFAYSNTTWDDFETGKMSFWDGEKSPELYWLQVKEELKK